MNLDLNVTNFKYLFHPHKTPATKKAFKHHNTAEKDGDIKLSTSRVCSRHLE